MVGLPVHVPCVSVSVWSCCAVPAIAGGELFRGACGAAVTSLPSLSTAVHCHTDGHATARTSLPASIATGVGAPGEVGSNVTSRAPAIAVHWALDGHATDASP